MTASRHSRRVLALAFLALVATWSVQASDAQLWIVWRAAVVSWDSPVTQFQDELASQGVVDLDAARHLREHVGAALRPAGRLAPPPEPPGGDAVALGARLARSPPAA